MTDFPPASTQVLMNDDILYGIFTFVKWSYLSDGNQDHCLARCATVCRAFHEPAVRVLWRNLKTPLHLWQPLAPPDAPHPYFKGGDGDELKYLRKVSCAQLYRDPIRWDRFLWHTAHVRILVRREDDSQEIKESHRLLMHSVVMHNGGNTVLPLLHSIEWWGVPFKDSLSLLFGPSLRRIAFLFAAVDEVTKVQLLRRLHQSSPALEEIIIDAGEEPQARSSLTKELVSFDRLFIVNLLGPGIGLADFRDHMTKPNLTSLATSITTGPWVGLDRTVSVRDLRKLVVRGSVPALSAAFNLVRFQALETAEMECRLMDADTPTHITAILTLFCNAVSPSVLQRLTLHVPEFASFRRQPALRDLIAPLLSLRGVCYFRFISLGSSDSVITRIDDPDVEALAGAWPKLKHLLLEGQMKPGPAVSINAIHHLYRHCQDLKELTLPRLLLPIIGVHAIPSPFSPRGSGLHTMRRLSVQQMCVATNLYELSDTNAEAWARYLLDLFPRLDPEEYRQRMSLSCFDPVILLPLEPLETLPGDPGWITVLGRMLAICFERGRC